jgi:hypothetical protein
MLSLEERKKKYTDMVQRIWDNTKDACYSKDDFDKDMSDFFNFGTDEGQIVFQKIRAGYDFEVEERPLQNQNVVVTSTGTTVEYQKDGSFKEIN